MEGGCQIPIGALAEVRKNGLYLTGLVASIDGEITLKKTLRGSKKNAEKLGKLLASDLIKAGAKKILKDVYKSR